MSAHEEALRASIAKLRGNGHMKMALDLENELRRLRAAKPKVAKTKPPPPDPDDDTLDPDDDDEPDEDAAPKPAKPKKVKASTFTARDGSTMTIDWPEPASIGPAEHEFVMRTPDPRADLAAAIGMPPELARGLSDRELLMTAPGWSKMTKAIERGRRPGR